MTALPAPGGLLYRAPPALAALLVFAAIGYPLASGAARDTVTWIVVALGSALSVAHATAAHGPRTGWGLLVAVIAFAVTVEAVGLATGFPFGRYGYGAALGPTLAGVPLLVPLAWLMMAWPSWVLGRRLAASVPEQHRRVVRVVVAAAVLAAWDVVLDPQMVQAGYWTWANPSPGLPGIDTVPLTNLAGWLLAGLALMALVDHLVAGTSVPGAPRVGDVPALVALGWMTLGGALAHAGWLGLPGSAVWGAVLAVPVLAVAGVRHRRAARGRPVNRRISR